MRLPYFRIDFRLDFGVTFKVFAHFFAALRNLFVAIIEPRAALCKNAVFNAEVDKTALLRNALAVNYVEFGNLEGRRNLILYNLTFCTVAYNAAVAFKRVSFSYI